MLRSVVLEVARLDQEPGTVHLVAVDGRRRLDDGRCNLDDVAGSLVEVELPAAIARTRLCGHCFGDLDLVEYGDHYLRNEVRLVEGRLP